MQRGCQVPTTQTGRLLAKSARPNTLLHTEVVRGVPQLLNFVEKKRSSQLDALKEAWREMNLWIIADESLSQSKGIPMPWTIIVILVILWLFGLIGQISYQVDLWNRRIKQSF